MISARIIADSINQHGCRLTSFVVTFPRIVLAEFNTHRMISKNSASSRAIPFHKMLQMVQERPFIPMRFQKEHKGMQGFEYHIDPEEIKAREIAWLTARNKAVESAIALSEMNVTKQICNRLLEPFMFHTVICTGTDWQNFFALRAHEDAEIHIQELAYRMLDVYNESTPKSLSVGEWHIPFGEQMDEARLMKILNEDIEAQNSHEYDMLKVKIATARCARVSYQNFEGKDDYQADLELYKRLLTSGHMSPFEHCAVADNANDYCGNFRGFVQLRKYYHAKEENKRDPRVQVKAWKK